MGQYAPNGAMHASGFDSARAEAAFSAAGPSGAPPSTVGGGFGNGNMDGGAPDPFHFLGTDLGNLSLHDNNNSNRGGRNAGPGASRSPNN